MRKTTGAPTTALIVIFKGGDQYLTGLPARAMPISEWETYPDNLRAEALSLGLYEITEAATPEEPAS